jgi:TRAP-type C4-dicarboxylate transport system permease small subunit
MAKSDNSLKLALGVALLVAGALLIWWGYDESQALANRLSRALSGSQTDRVMWKYIAGAVCAAAGTVLLIRR